MFVNACVTFISASATHYKVKKKKMSFICFINLIQYNICAMV